MDWTGSHADVIAKLLDDRRWSSSAAAFDADGTLWEGDLGELVLARLVASGHLPPDSVERYSALAQTDMVAACAFCVRVMAGMPISHLSRATGEVIVAREHGPLIAPTIELAQELLRRGAEVWIVSGSSAFSVRPAAIHAGLGAAGVIAVTGGVEGDRLTGTVDAPVPCRRGKVEALQLATRRPLLLASGNSDYDLDLLEHAEVRVAVGPRGRQTYLVTEAEKRGWVTLRI